MLAIIVPVLNEAAQLQPRLRALQKYRAFCQLIVVDGGSTDSSVELARPWADLVISSKPGRARQMNAGAAHASTHCRLLLFLHIDTQLPDNFEIPLFASLLDSRVDNIEWGFFKLGFDNQAWPMTLIARMINWRSRVTQVATGDQGIFVRAEVFRSMAGFADIPLMEDVEISKRLRKRGRPMVIPQKITTAARRWQRHGVVKTVLLMWSLRLQYFFGVKPERLAAKYYPNIQFEKPEGV